MPGKNCSCKTNRTDFAGSDEQISEITCGCKTGNSNKYRNSFNIIGNTGEIGVNSSDDGCCGGNCSCSE